LKREKYIIRAQAQGIRAHKGCRCTPKSQTHTINEDGEPLDPTASPEQASKCANMEVREIIKL
jgi:hypothetical protein